MKAAVHAVSQPAVIYCIFEFISGQSTCKFIYKFAHRFYKTAQNLDLGCVLLSDPSTFAAGAGGSQPKHAADPE